MKSFYLVLLGIFCGLLAAGVILVIESPQRGAPVELPPAPTQAALLVDVSGAVVHPGVYELPAGSRVEDAIAAAGGMLAEAYSQTLNMAAPLSDGSKVLVPILEENTSPSADQPAGAESSGTVTFPININTAPLEILVELPGIGEVKAQAIIDYRTQHGPFASPEAIQNVSGIGSATYEKIKDLITIY